MLQYVVAICCNMVRCVAVCCGVLQSVAVRGIMLQHNVAIDNVAIATYVNFHNSHLPQQFGAFCCNIMLQFGALCCNMLWKMTRAGTSLRCVAVCCSVLQCVAVRCNVLWRMTRAGSVVLCGVVRRSM